MCGIFAYTGNKNASKILIDGLKALEYRGYDSSGIFVHGVGNIKSTGGIENLKEKIGSNFQGTTGISHLRWATHGQPTKNNAHPHTDCTEKVFIVHNGIIENYKEIKEKLISLGHKFISETDSEVISHLIEDNLKTEKDFENAVSKSLSVLNGTFGIIASYVNEPNKIIVARMGAPVVLGIGDGENFVASDPSPIIRHTKNIVYLHDGDIAIVTPDSYDIYTLDNNIINRDIEVIDWEVEQIQKDGHEHFMLKEIINCPNTVNDTLRGRLMTEEGLAKLGGLEIVADKLRDINRIIIVGCGSAYYAGLIGEYMLEEYAEIQVEVEIGSEFRYRKPIIDKNTVVLAISQSGETADTLEAIREAKRKGALTLGIVNTVGSTIARETDAGIYNHAGPEIGVASTKAFISQITALSLITIFLGRQRQMSLTMGKRIGEELLELPKKIDSILNNKEEIRKLAEKYSKYKNLLYIGRKYNYPIAFEGALKLKEVSYVHAEGYGAGEMKHGPLAMIDENFPTVAISLDDSVYKKVISNMEEIKARKGKVLAIATEGDSGIKSLADDVMYIPKTLEMLSPILSIIPLQLFAYYFALKNDCNVDKPRNLAKSVTVE